MRARPRAPPFAAVPVAEVVTALAARTAPVRHLVPLETGVGQTPVEQLVAVGQHVVVGSGDLAAAHPACQRGAVLDHQRVGRHMVHTRVDGRIDRAPQIVVALPRRAVDQVEVDVPEARRLRLDRGGHRPSRRVHPVQHGQHMPGHRLHAQRDPRVAGGQQPVEQLWRRGLRVGLGRHLGVCGEREILPHRIEHRGETPGTQQGRRAAADEHGVDPGVVPSRSAASPSSARTAASHPSGLAPSSSPGV